MSGAKRTPEVWLALPSASVEMSRKNLPAWRAMGYKVAVYQGRERGEIPADVCVYSDEYHGWSDAVNRLCLSIVPKSADIVVAAGDDMLPDPHVDAGTIGRQFLERYPDLFGVMQPHGDPYLGARLYCGSPWMGRAYFENMYGGRGPTWPQYRHNWTDNEITGWRGAWGCCGRGRICRSFTITFHAAGARCRRTGARTRRGTIARTCSSSSRDRGGTFRGMSRGLGRAGCSWSGSMTRRCFGAITAGSRSWRGSSSMVTQPWRPAGEKRLARHFERLAQRGVRSVMLVGEPQRVGRWGGRCSSRA